MSIPVSRRTTRRAPAALAAAAPLVGLLALLLALVTAPAASRAQSYLSDLPPAAAPAPAATLGNATLLPGETALPGPATGTVTPSAAPQRVPGSVVGPSEGAATTAASPPAPAPAPAAQSAAAAPTSGKSPTDLMHARLDQLFAMVDQGRGHEVYPVLKARFDGEMAQVAKEPGVDAAPLRKAYLIALLRAGEGLAPPAEQEQTARAFTDYYPDDDRFPLAFFYLNEALFEQGKPLAQSFFFDQDAFASLPAWMQTRLLRMEAQSAAGQKHYAQAAGDLLQELQSSSSLQQTTRAEVEDMLERMEDPGKLIAFLEKHADVQWLYGREPFLMARVLFNNGQFDQSLLKLDAILSQGQATSAADLKFVNELKQQIRARVATRPDRIGVLLPLSSSASVLRELALETLEGLRMAVQFPAHPADPIAHLSRMLGQDLPLPVGDHVNNAGPPPLHYELIIRDTANDPRKAAAEVASLVHDDHVVAIIGPIARAESAAAAQEAETLGVPLISFSLSLDIPPGAKYVFRHSKSQEEEVRDLVRYALDYLHDKRFAILYPDTPYGHTMSTLFWQQVDQRGGKVVAVGAYQPSARVTHDSRNAVGLKEIFQRFTGLNRYVSPQDEALLQAVGDTHPDPIVDFDALYIPVGPDGIQDLQLIAPYPATVDAEHVQLLGSRFWNDSSVLVAGDGKLNGAVFVDAFDLTSTNPKVEAFRRRHRAFFGHHAQYRPPTYYTGLGYDTANLLMSLLKDPHNRSRPALREALVHMQPYFGVTGWTRFKADGDAEKESMFFRIKGDEIVRLLP